MIESGVAICTYNRHSQIKEVTQAVLDTVPSGTRVVVCDDGSGTWQEGGSMSAQHEVSSLVPSGALYVRGPNLGVAANKNRALFTLQDCKYICILEDDLMPTKKGWFEDYAKAATLSGIHHFCRVQDKLEDSLAPEFDSYMAENHLHPTYGPSPRGDLTFLTHAVVRTVGAFHPDFRGVGYAHGEWSNRVRRAGLINHPNKWVDILECSAKFEQVGDTEGGRWDEDEKKIKRQLQRNKQVLRRLQKTDYTHHELVLE